MHPTARTQSALPLATLVVAVVTMMLSLLAPSAPAAAQTNSEYDACLKATSLDYFNVSARSTFNRSSTLSWQANFACSGMSLRLDGESVAATGSRTVQPTQTTTYMITAHLKTLSRVVGSQTVIAGKTIGYTTVKSTLVPVENHGTAASAVTTQARRTFDALPQGNRALLDGLVVEVHIIPTSRKLTDLPLFRHLTEDEDGRSYRDMRGVGGRIFNGNRLALAVGSEEMVFVNNVYPSRPLGYILQHELGHTVLDYATTSAQKTTNVNNYNARKAAGGPWLGSDSYTSSRPGEYFAEATAALFSYPYDSAQINKYTPHGLNSLDPAQYQLLHQVFSLR